MRALVSVDAAGEPARAATADHSREVRVTIAKALATVTAGQPDGTTSAGLGPGMALSALAELIADPDALVRAAAYETLGTTGHPAPLAARAEAALSDPAQQVPPPPCPWPLPASP
ncbi:HEAT repeat domain-containing protein [Streptomyces wuyuanensis]|uniref:HEAT repeat domain-containing protein n=1 Tax=Streptomyces wuyuanensis TaxID=1196353 RepID=UPI00367811CE